MFLVLFFNEKFVCHGYGAVLLSSDWFYYLFGDDFDFSSLFRVSFCSVFSLMFGFLLVTPVSLLCYFPV